jgi:uncharacterized membrane protein
MKKTLILLITLISFLSVALFVDAQTIKPFGPTDFTDLFTKITAEVTKVVGSIAGIMFIVAGIIYLTSAGDPERMNLAKKALTYAIIGLIVAIAAGSIVKMITTATGTGT